MTQSQNEKDREFLDERLDDFEHQDNIHVRDQRTMFDIANRILKEREKAEEVYKLFDKQRLETHYYKNISFLYSDRYKQEKGVWIPVEEA
ncbi:hypothetical protein [Listeria booriae]|uniref:hypothetical protein n=1 Tax=Listeria booriae TaxID=1552123 RepID=UPI0016277655|nr:hypothetical protein [Listeria booriae]MBC1801023.1 hypothetical protein [Listeria booriae]